MGGHDVIGRFEFSLPTRIVWRTPAAAAVVEEVDGLGARRVVVVSDPGVAATGMLSGVAAALEGAGVAVTTAAEVEGNPTTKDVAVVRGAVEASGSTALVALGGGSVLDTAKAAAMLVANGGEYADYQWHARPVTERSLPWIAVPTTAGTGSEVTKVAVISDPERPLKKGVLSPLMVAGAAILDPALTLSLPPHLTAATGIDAFTHGLEAFVGNRVSPLSDLPALEAIRLVWRYLPRAVKDGTDLEAREQMMLAALYGGVALDQGGLGLIHALSGGLCNHLPLHHGRANALLLPYVMEFNLPAIDGHRLQVLADAVGMSPGGLADGLAGFVTGLGLEVGLAAQPDADWDAVASESMQMAMIPNNPRAVDADDCLAILAGMR